MSMGTLSAPACASACASTYTCNAWLIDPSNGGCSHWVVPTGLAISASCFSGNPGSWYGAVDAAVAPALTSNEICTTSAWEFCAACPLATYWGFGAGSMSSVSQGVLPAPACLQACDASSSCDAWLINPADGTCYLWTLSSPGNRERSCESGPGRGWTGAIKASSSQSVVNAGATCA